MEWFEAWICFSAAGRISSPHGLTPGADHFTPRENISSPEMLQQMDVEKAGCLCAVWYVQSTRLLALNALKSCMTENLPDHIIAARFVVPLHLRES